MRADIGTKRALNAGKPVEFDPKRKSPHWGKRKLARDRCQARAKNGFGEPAHGFSQLYSGGIAPVSGGASHAVAAS